MGGQFWRVRPSKNRCRERLRTAPARKNDKNRLRRRLRTHFFGPGPVFLDFCVPAGSQNDGKTAPCKMYDVCCSGRKLIFSIFFARARSGRVPDRFWRLRGPSRTRFSLDFAILLCWFRRDLVRVCRVPPGCCRDPQPTSVTHSPGFPWGTAIREAV